MSTAIIDLVARQNWLDGAAAALGRLTGLLARSRDFKDVLHGVWLGHPVHAVVTDVPVGAWTASFVLDLAEAATGDRALGRAADSAMAVGLAGSALAAVTGMADWHDTDGRPRRIGVVHATLNTLAAGLYAASLANRRRGCRETGRLLSLAGFAVAGFSAYLGGSLVYDEKVGVDHAPRDLPREFVPVAEESALEEGKPLRADAGGIPVVLVRSGDHIYALAATCAHQGGPLQEGKVEGGNVTCPWHGSTFRLEDGSVVHGPSVYPQPCLEARVRDGRVEVRAGAH